MRLAFILLCVAACGHEATFSDAASFDAPAYDSATATDAAIDAPTDARALDAAPMTFAYYSGLDGVEGFALGADGSLAPLAGDWPAITGGNSLDLAVSPDGGFLYTANFTDSTLSSFAIDRATGALTRLDGDPSIAGIQDYPAQGAGPAAIAIDPQGRALYVAHASAGTLATYTIDTGTGALTLRATIAVATAPRGIAIDPLGHTLAIAGYTTPGRVTICTLAADGTPTAIDADPIAAGRQDALAGNGTVRVAYSADGLYASNSDGGTVSAWAIDASGSLTARATATVAQPLGLTIAGGHLYVADSATGVAAFDLAADGTATPTTGGATLAMARAVAIAPDRSVLLAAADASSLASYAIAADGSLTPITALTKTQSGGYAIAIAAPP